MKILHTSDWHLGKVLEGYSRLPEQEKFIEELIEIADNQDVDLVLIAGDVYDTVNPSSQAVTLFYNTLKILSKNGERPIVVIAGNHDSPERLMAASPLARDYGVILLGKPNSEAMTGEYGSVMIEEAGEGYIKIQLNGEKAVILTLPYPSEKRLNEILTEEADESVRQKSYSERVGTFFKKLSKHFEQDTINLALSHLYMIQGEECGSERDIQLGGSFAVDTCMLPDAQYIALGHLHRPQKVAGMGNRAFYSGSPIQYSRSEINYSKCVYVVDVKPGEEPQVEEVLLCNYKPIEVWECESIEAALQKCADHQEGERWVYLDIKTDRPLHQEEIKEMKSLRKDIVSITPVFPDKDDESGNEMIDYKQFKIDELFERYYKEKIGAEAPAEIMDLFYEIAQEVGSEDEADPIKD